MEITKQRSKDRAQLRVNGRLDSYWAHHLASALDEEIHQGAHHILLDLSQVAFLSSAGIGILVKFYQQLKSIEGSLAISESSEQVRKVLEISGLKEVLLAKAAPATEGFTSEDGVQPAAPTKAPTGPGPIAQIEWPEVALEVHALAPESRLRCRLLGNPYLLKDREFRKEDCRAMEFPDSAFAIGLGALGEHFEDCQGRFGEFIAAAGAVAYLPTDGSNTPDYLLATGKSVPDVQICYGIACEGQGTQPFSRLVRFEANKEAGSVTLARLVEACLNLEETGRVGIVMIAEAAGLMGAALRRSPAHAAREKSRFEFPGIREWLTFTAERAHTRTVVLVAGVATRGDCEALAPVVRPLSQAANAGGLIAGHFHAAAFSYRPLQKGDIDLKSTVRKLFEGQVLESVLHLFTDDRAIAGAEQSEFIRGASWIGAIREIASEGNAA
jgi:anti-anti-sigma factor